MKIGFWFDVAATLIFVFLLGIVCLKKMYHDRTNQIFVAFLAVTALTALSGMLTNIFVIDSLRDYIVLRYALHMMYLVMRALNGPLYVLYLIALTDTWHKFRENVPARICFVMPFLVVFTLLIANFFTHHMFFLDANLVYTRGSGFFLLYLAAACYFIQGLVLLIWYRKLLPWDRWFSLFAILPFTLLALLIQGKWPSVTVEMLANALAFMVIVIMVQRLDDVLDSFTGLRKHAVYVADMERNFINGKVVDIILANVANYEILLSVLGFDAMNEVLQIMGATLMKIRSRFHCQCGLYYLDRARFRVVLSGKDREKTEEIAQWLNHIQARGLVLNQLQMTLQTYICVLQCPTDVGDVESLMRIGNEFSRNTEYTGEVMHAEDILAENQFGLNNELGTIIENAIVNHSFEVYYQPIYSVKEKKFTTAEALIRLNDKNYGFIPPSVFIPAAEMSGSIHQIGDFVMEEVCRFLASGRPEELGISYIEVNLSVNQCMKKGLADKVLAIMDQYGVKPNQINLEITETAASYAQASMMENLNRLSAAGIRFSLDDYGTGYSNIKRIISLPLTIVKLDKTFVDEKDNPRMWIALQNTVKMIKDMDMEIVVEGVETEKMVQEFSNLQCDYIQGFYYSKPLPEKEFVNFLRNAL